MSRTASNLRFLLGLAVLAALAVPARSMPIAIGALALEGDFGLTYRLIRVVNYTGDPADGGYALPPDYPVYTPLRLDNPTITYIDLDGASLTVAACGTPGCAILPGSSDPPDYLIFGPLVQFQTIIFNATIYPGVFTLDTLETYVAVNGLASARLQLDPQPDGTPTPLPDWTYGDITVDADPYSSVPEPASALLLGSVLLAGLAALKRKRS